MRYGFGVFYGEKTTNLGALFVCCSKMVLGALFVYVEEKGGVLGALFVCCCGEKSTNLD